MKQFFLPLALYLCALGAALAVDRPGIRENPERFTGSQPGTITPAPKFNGPRPGVLPLTNAPAAPDPIGSQQGGSSLLVSWPRVPGATHYRVFVDGRLYRIVTTTNSSFSLIHQGPNYHTNQLTVSAVNAFGESAQTSNHVNWRH